MTEQKVVTVQEVVAEANRRGVMIAHLQAQMAKQQETIATLTNACKIALPYASNDAAALLRAALAQAKGETP